MTLNEPASPSADAGGLPADPVRYRRKGVWIWFWLLIVFSLACIVLGVVIARYVPTWFPPKDQAAVQAAPPLPWRASLAEPVEAAVATPTAAEAAPDPKPAADMASLTARLAELERAQARTLQAATGALAASTLIQAAQTSRPFGAELAAVEHLLPASGDVAQLRRLAQTGAPTRALLAAEFPEAAARAIAAAGRPDSRSGLVDRVRYAFSHIVTIRRIDYAEGDGPHAVLARAERRIVEGDIEGALSELDALPPAARNALGDWRVGAERRAEVDRRIAAVREASLRALRESAA